jgi:WD40 repeat protein
MISAADRTIRIWDWTTGRHISTLAAHDNAVREFFLTDQRVVSGGTDRTLLHEMREEVRAVWHLVSNTNTIALALLVERGKHLIEMWDASALR